MFAGVAERAPERWQKLGLEDRRWNDLFQPQYLSVLDDDAIDENAVEKCSVDLVYRLGERAHLKLHAGPGRVSRTMQTPNGLQTVQDPDVRFILDLDLYTGAQTKLPEVMADLSALHEHADRVFSEAITDTLHEAMSPVEV